MASQTHITIVDDLDGSVGAANVRFALDGKSYEIDLSEANDAKLREVLAPFVAAARKAGSAPVLRSVGGTASRATARVRTDNTEKRDFLRSAGFPVSERGRLSRDAEAAWSAELARRATVGAETPTEAPEAASDAVSGPEETSPVEVTTAAGEVRTKVGKLTSANITALRDVGLLLEGSGATFAILAGDRPTAMKTIEKLMGDMAVKKGHPYSSLVAVRLKLRNNEERFVEQLSA